MSESYSGDHPDGKIPDSDSQKLTDEKEEWLRNLPEKSDRYIEPNQLPAWSKRALAMFALGRYDSMKEAAKANDRAPRTLYNYKNTPAGEAYLKQCRETVDDPEAMMKNLLRGELHGFTLDFMQMMQRAKEAGDYAEFRKFWESIMDRVPGGLAKQGDIDVEQATITVSFDSPEQLKPAEGETEYEVVEADYEIEDD